MHKELKKRLCSFGFVLWIKYWLINIFKLFVMVELKFIELKVVKIRSGEETLKHSSTKKFKAVFKRDTCLHVITSFEDWECCPHVYFTKYLIKTW